MVYFGFSLHFLRQFRKSCTQNMYFFYETCNFYLSNSYVLQNVHSFVEFVQFYA